MALERSSSPTEDMLEYTADTYANVVKCNYPHASQSETFQTQVLALLGSLQSDMQSMGDRVSRLERARSVPPDTPKGKGKGQVPPHNSDEEDAWDDEDREPAEANKSFKVAEKTEKFLSNAFSSVVPNTTRRQWRDKYGAPNTVATACPNMDKVIKSRLPAVTKLRDRQLAKQQALMLDAVGPVTYILEEAVKGQLNQKSVIDAAQTALHLLGNASMHANRERRRNVIQSMNPQILDMADEDAIYEAAAPSLFGDGFCKKAKERDEELQSLKLGIHQATCCFQLC